MTSPSSAELFEQHRGLLFRVAYDVLGTVVDAEDVVQESWLRWHEVDPATVENPRAYLVRIATNQALNRVRSLKARRETYVGPWLPEPLVAAGGAGETADPADRVERGEAVSLAMLVVLETLSPSERAVFVLREVFGMTHDEIAEALDRSPSAVRQLAHRAREHVQARRPRFPAANDERRRVTEQFLLACATGDLQGLTRLLHPEVTLVGDAGGFAKAPRRPILGADKVGRFMIAIAPDAVRVVHRFALINDEVGVVGYEGDTVTSAMLLDVADGRIMTVFLMANPHKLAHIAAPA